MAYVIFTANGDEIDRRELTAPVTIGRAQDADIPVRDILLSRNHCRIEPAGDQWVVTDLGSKNGTYLGYRQIARHQLKDGDELRIGRTRVTFRAGAFEEAPPGTKRRDVVRPADPTDALAGTVAGFLLVEPGEVERQPGAPVPQPRPPEPRSYESEDVYGMLNEIASSSWDSIVTQASRPVVMERPLPRPSGYRAAPAAARRPRVAFCLQAPVSEDQPTDTPATNDLAHPSVPDPLHPARVRRRPAGARWWNLPAKALRNLVYGVLSILATTLLVGAWVVAVNQGPRAGVAAPLPRPEALTPSVAPDLVDITFPAPARPTASKSAPLVSPAAEPDASQATFSMLPRDEPMPSAATMKTVLRLAAVQFLAAR